MNKKQREAIFNKFNGHCAYCGEPLSKGWHVDELLPCRRKYKYADAHFKDKDGNKVTMHEGTKLSEEELQHRGLRYVERKLVADGYEHPERLTIENQVPACPSCNINKHSMDLEEFRKLIEGFVTSLNRDSVQYKVAKRYGLVKENLSPVVFYFERINQQATHPTSG